MIDHGNMNNSQNGGLESIRGDSPILFIWKFIIFDIDMTILTYGRTPHQKAYNKFK